MNISSVICWVAGHKVREKFIYGKWLTIDLSRTRGIDASNTWFGIRRKKRYCKRCGELFGEDWDFTQQQRDSVMQWLNKYDKQ